MSLKTALSRAAAPARPQYPRSPTCLPIRRAASSQIPAREQPAASPDTSESPQLKTPEQAPQMTDEERHVTDKLRKHFDGAEVAVQDVSGASVCGHLRARIHPLAPALGSSRATLAWSPCMGRLGCFVELEICSARVLSFVDIAYAYVRRLRLILRRSSGPLVLQRSHRRQAAHDRQQGPRRRRQRVAWCPGASDARPSPNVAHATQLKTRAP